MTSVAHGNTALLLMFNVMIDILIALKYAYYALYYARYMRIFVDLYDSKIFVSRRLTLLELLHCYAELESRG